ncbi:MAG TPA: hypothetical protein VH396_00450 [Chitinophagaceae bacterium]
MKSFFDDNNFLYKYYRSELTYPDDKLFVQEDNDANNATHILSRAIGFQALPVISFKISVDSMLVKPNKQAS